jgi:L-ascorbate metabolism protein UlaG (beta-lactamase superfamily)
MSVRVEYIGHACLLLEAGGERIITDPWFTDPVMANSWYHVPAFSRGLGELPHLDYIYISHEHADHLDIPALRQLDEDATIVIPAYGDGKMEATLAAAGLKQTVVTLADGEELVTPGGATLALYFADTGSKDSSLIVAHGDGCVYDHTDNWITPEKMARIGERWDVDIAFQCYAGVGSFPSYMLWPLDYRIAVGDSKKLQLFERMKKTAEALRPKALVPFGASFGYLRPETLWLNKVCATSPTECREWLEEQGVEIPVVLMDHGDIWTVEDGVQAGTVKHPLEITDETIEEYCAHHAQTIERVRAAESIDDRYLALNDRMLGQYLKRWVDVEGAHFVADPLSIQFNVSGAHGTTWTVDFAAEEQIVTKAIPAQPNLFLSLTETELFNAMVHRHYSLTDLYLSSRIQMNRYPYETYHKRFFDSLFWWDEQAAIEENRALASEVGESWTRGMIE